MASISAAYELRTGGAGLRVVAGQSLVEGNEWSGEVQVCDVTESGALEARTRRCFRSGVTAVAPLDPSAGAEGAGVAVVGCDSGDAFVVNLSAPGPEGEADDEDLDFTLGAESVLGHHHSTVSAVAALPGGSQVVTASWDGTAAVFDAATGALTAAHGKPGSSRRLLSCASSPSGCVVLGGEGGAAAWDPRAASAAASALVSAVPVTAAAPAGDWLVALGFESGCVGCADARSLGRGLLLLGPRAHRGPVTALAASAAAGGSVRVVSGGGCGTLVVTAATAGSDAVSEAEVTRLPSMRDTVTAIGTTVAGSWSIDRDGRAVVHA